MLMLPPFFLRFNLLSVGLKPNILKNVELVLKIVHLFYSTCPRDLFPGASKSFLKRIKIRNKMLEKILKKLLNKIMKTVTLT